MAITHLLLLILIFGKGHPTPDPECYMTLPEIAKYYDYPAEVHLVRTADDYILELHRIRRGKQSNLDVIIKRINLANPVNNRLVVFMQHGLLADGNNFLPNLANESAGSFDGYGMMFATIKAIPLRLIPRDDRGWYQNDEEQNSRNQMELLTSLSATVFADAGMDVWIANSRGTPPSQKHIGFGPDDSRFWNFSWQEMSMFDLTASVDYVLKETGQDSLYYIGHSQGTVIMFDRLSEDPGFAKKIRQFHALAPVASVSHIGGLFRLFGDKFYEYLQLLLKRVPNYPLYIPKFLQKIFSLICSLPIARNVCTLDIGVIDGSEKLFNMSRVGTYMCHMPAATSTKDLLHWVQLVKSRRFQKFDYGPEGNQIEYGQPTPPIFNLSRINTPTYLYWSKDDILADTEDIRETILTAMNGTIKRNVELPHYTHLDFVYGLDAARDVYEPIINAIRTDGYDRSRQQMLKHNRIY